jgi:hypothetical protein
MLLIIIEIIMTTIGRQKQKILLDRKRIIKKIFIFYVSMYTLQCRFQQMKDMEIYIQFLLPLADYMS